MPIPVEQIILRVSIILNDDEHVRWPLDELLGWINDAAGEIVVRRPQANSIIADLTMVEGALQSIPERGIQLLDVVRNKPGKSISRVSRGLLDDQEPDWYDRKTTDKIRHYTLELETPKRFYVYPPAKAGAVVEAKYSQQPAAVTDPVAGIVDLDLEYIGPIVSYVLYRSYAKDSEYANGTLAVTHFQAFNEALGASTQVNQAVNQLAGTE